MRCFGNLLGRRSFLSVGALGAVGLSLPDFFRIQKVQAEQKHYDFIQAKAESVIHIFLPGGMAQQESFDPKPYSPIEYRGEMGSIKTNTGELFSETLPRLASLADRLTVIRSMTHGEAAHERGTHNMFTGYKPSPALIFPSFGSVVSHEYGPRNNLPPYVAIPNVPNEFATSGYLSSSYGPFALGADPAQGGFKVQDLNMAGGVDVDRFNRRREALTKVNQYFSDRQSSEKAREAFNIDAEDAGLRDKYGRNEAGQRMLLSRRLVEAGVRFVTMTYGGWDHHYQITNNFRNQMPPFDQALATLIEDLESRGMLEKTLVMVSSEFGRTPKINNDAGRDHWPKVFSVMLAGGGVKKGLIYGSSDATSTEPDTNPVSPEDLATTMYHLLGIVADKELMAPGDRPIEICDGGKLLTDILA
jgi:hypothetical protein